MPRNAASALTALVLSALSALVCATPLSAQDEGGWLAQALPIDSSVALGTLENGVRYYIRINDRPENRAELRLVVNAGSVLEDDDQLGLAHFVEHMAFNGTANFEKQELVRYMESIGMKFGPHVNAYTAFDETVYMLTIPTDDPGRVETAFQVLEDWAHLQAFDPEEIEKERGVVIEEWRLGRGASARMLDKQLPIVFKDSRYAERLPIGVKETLESFYDETLRRFYRDWYRPDLMAVVAVGDFRGRIDVVEGETTVMIATQVVERLIRKHFSRIPPAANPRPRTIFEVPDHPESLFAIATDKEAPSTFVSVGHKQPVRERGTVGASRQRIVEGLYNYMLNQRFFELAQKPDAPFLGAFSGQNRMVRSKEVYFLGAGAHEGGVEKALQALLVEGERVARHGFTETELKRAKVELLRRIEQAYDDRETRESVSYAAEYVQHFLTGEPIPGIELELELHERFLPTVRVEEVNRLAREWITDHSRVVMVSAPEKAEVPVPGEDELRAVIGEVSALEIAPYEDSAAEKPLVAQLPEPAEIVAVERIEEVDVTIWELANGLRVLLKPTDFKDDQIVFRAYSPGGSSLVPDDEYHEVFTAAEIVGQGGVGSFSLVDLKKKLAGKAVRVSPSIESLRERMSGDASPKDVETLFQLIYLYFTQPRKDSAAFVAYQNRIKGFLANRSASPMAAFRDTLRVTMAQGHARARPWTAALLEELDLNESYDFYRDRFADASDFTFVFVGSFDLDSVKPLVQTWLGGLPSIARHESWRDVGMDPPSGMIRKVVRKGIEPQSRTQILFTGAFEYNHANRQALQSLAEALQIRLRDVMREDLGGTYSVGVSRVSYKYPEEEYRISITFGSAPERVEELVAVVFREIEEFRTAGPTPEEAESAREILRRRRETDLKENVWWAWRLLSSEFHEEDPRDLTSFKWIDGISVEMIRSVAERYLRTDNYVQVSLYPETPTSESERDND